MKYVACYCRVSTDEQKKFGFSIQAQKDALEQYCKENNYRFEFFIDEGISASSMKKRKALNEMLNKANTFDMILFTKLDRLSRNVLDANNINLILKENNCTMKAIDEDDVDTSTADGLFIFNLKVSLAQREIGKTSERIKFVFENKRKKGEITSGSKKYGYNIVDKKYVINSEEAEKLNLLYQYFISVNGNIQETYKYFIKHFPNKGYDTLSSYLRDTAYIGKYKLYRKNEYIDNYTPQIITDEIFNTVQNLLQRRERTTNSISSLFSGLLYCNSCHKRLVKKVDYRVSNIVIRYSCNNSYQYILGTLDKRCHNSKLIREEYIENYLINNLKTEAEKYKTKIVAIKKFSVKDNSKEIDIINKKLYKLKDLYLDDLIDKEVYEKDYQKYTNEIKKLKEKIIEKTLPVNIDNLNKLLNSNIENLYNSLHPEQKRKFWLSYIDKIYIENGEVKEVIFL